MREISDEHENVHLEQLFKDFEWHSFNLTIY